MTMAMDRRTFVKAAGATAAMVAAGVGAVGGASASEGAADSLPSMAPGTYEAQAYGFYPGMPVTVDVTVSAGAIESIDIVGDNMETPHMIRSVRDRLVPRMLDSQSVAVDAICGATLSSFAVKLACADCIRQAYEAAGEDPANEERFEVAPTYVTAEEPRVIDTDVLVVGLGGSGIACALSAADSGARVLAIDKAGRYGGTICVTGEALGINPPKLDEQYNGGQDYVDEAALYEDWTTRTHGDARDNLIQLLLDESGDTIDWMMYDHGWPYGEPQLGHADYATFNVSCHYLPDENYGNKDKIAGYLDKLMADYVAAGGQYLLEVEATELLTNEAGAVCGVKAQGHDGQQYQINAKAVAIGTGGYGQNKELMERFMVNDYFPLAGEWHQYGMTTNDGKMIQSALGLGAGTYNPSVPPIVHLQGFPVNLTGFGTHTKDGQTSFFTGRTPIWSEGDIPLSLDVAADALAVTREGKRFINEQDFATTSGGIKSGPTYYTVWSQEQFDRYREEGFVYEDLGPSMGYLGCQSTIPAGTPLPQFDDVIAAAMETGYVTKADTVEDLAQTIGIDPATLRQTVDAYNAACEAGDDEEFHKDPQYLTRVGDGPYYAVYGCSFFYTTGGGLDVNERMQVLREDGETPVEGLYALGTDSVGVILSEQEQYVDYGGADAGWCFTSGRLAGRNMAEAVA